MKYAYNYTFDMYYECPLTLKEANAYVKEHNMYKGGRWTVHSEKQYKAWKKKHPSKKPKKRKPAKDERYDVLSYEGTKFLSHQKYKGE